MSRFYRKYETHRVSCPRNSYFFAICCYSLSFAEYLSHLNDRQQSISKADATDQSWLKFPQSIPWRHRSRKSNCSPGAKALTSSFVFCTLSRYLHPWSFFMRPFLAVLHSIRRAISPFFISAISPSDTVSLGIVRNRREFFDGVLRWLQCLFVLVIFPAQGPTSSRKSRPHIYSILSKVVEKFGDIDLLSHWRHSVSGTRYSAILVERMGMGYLATGRLARRGLRRMGIYDIDGHGRLPCCNVSGTR